MPRPLPQHRRWVFECDAPRDEFLRAMKTALAARGVAISPAKVFDFEAEAWGARAYVKVQHDERGMEALVKLKSGLFGSSSALEDAVLSAGREAQAKFFAESA